MRVARFYDVGDIRIEERPIPRIGSDEALVKMAVCGVCTSDTLPWYVRRKAPIVLGHEPAGTLMEVGREVRTFSAGQRVFIHHHAPCLVCRFCLRGRYSMCPRWKASALDPGGLAEYVRVPAINLRNDTLLLPDALSFEDGALVEPAACAVQALKRRGRMQRGDRVLIIGMGVMGQILALVARHFGASQVIVADRVPYRLRKAVELGADLAVDVSREALEARVRDATSGEMPDLVVVGPGTLPAMQSGLACLGVGSTLLLFTPSQPDQTLRVNPYDLYARDNAIVTSYSCGPPDTREALDLLRSGALSARTLVTHRFPLDRAADAFATVAEVRASIKTLVVIDEEVLPREQRAS